MFDVFYIGKKPNQFAHEREVKSIAEAQELSRTRYFWIIHYLCDYSDFDFLWEPKPWEAHQRHVYASQWNKDSGTCLYPKAGYTDTQYHAGMIATRKLCFDNWDQTDIEEFDYSWHPDPTEPPFVYCFGTQWQKTGGPTYTVPGAVSVKYVAENRVSKTKIDDNWNDTSFKDFDYTWHPDETEDPYIYQFGTQWQKTGGPTYTVPGATVIKYVKAPRAVRTAQDDCWVLPHTEFGEFDFTWHPDATEEPMNYQFGTQWQKTGGPLYKVPGATQTKYVEQVKAENIAISREVYFIDHGNPEADETIKQLEAKGCAIKKRTRFIASYKGTLQRILSREEQEYVWICSSVCDYSDFDFSWHPEQWQGTMLHVFASNEQKFGDTFLVNVPSFNDRINKIELLEWYNTIHFVDDISVKRWPIENVKYDTDTLVDVVWEHEFTSPLAYFYKDTIPKLVPTVNLWREKTKAVISLKTDNSAAIIPRDAKNYLKTQVYDYPFIDKTYRGQIQSQTQDIVYISYDEPELEKNYEKLLSRFPNVKRVHGVKGMEQALIAAANESSTPWYFAVFAKTELEETFKFDFVPDYFQTPKHYIFNCRNRVNGLEYGHMGVILYNCNMVKNGPGYYNNNNAMSLDYTISFPTESIPLLSCHGNFDTSPYHTWRTSFREVAKLSYFESVEPTMDNQYRLKIWTTRAAGPYAQWALDGANDGIEFFNESGGDLSYMKQSFSWDWLRDRFVTKYGKIE